MAKGSIELINVTKKYFSVHSQQKVALKDINLTIHQGEFVGLVGLNGSGKSTLARLMNGLIQPTEGKVLVNGMNTSDKDLLVEIRRHVGMVFQNPDNQIISSIVEEDISFGPVNLKLSQTEVRDRIDWALKVLGLEELRYHAPHLLSGGQKQKVAIASALAMRPSYLILDEPTSMLDSEGRHELFETLRTLNKNYGMTIILISHHMEDVAGAERLIVLDQGTVYLEGAPWEVFASTEELSKVKLVPPEIFQITRNLRKKGHRIDQTITTLQQMVEYICQL